MKRLICASVIGMSSLLATSVAFAQQDVTLRMSWWGGKSRHEVMLNALQAFEARNPGIKVNAEYMGWDGYLERMTTQISGGLAPDVMQINWPWFPIFSRTGDGFYDINTLSDTFDLSQYPAKELKSTTINGKLNAIPISLNVPGFYYNTETWKKAGLAFPKNWDDLFAAGKVFKEKLGDEYYPLIFGDQDTFLMVNCYMSQKYNTPMFTPDGNHYAWNQEQWREAFRFIQRLVSDHVIPGPKYMASFGKFDFIDTKYWQDGKWAGTYTWNVVIQYYAPKLTPPAKLVLGDYVMYPGATNASAYFKVSLTYAISKDTKHPKEAAKLMNFLLNDPQAIAAIKLENGIPLSKIAVKTLTDDGTLTEENPSVAGFNAAQKLKSESTATSWMEDQKMQSFFQEARQNMDYGRMTPDQAADDFVAKSERLMKRSAART